MSAADAASAFKFDQLTREPQVWRCQQRSIPAHHTSGLLEIRPSAAGSSEAAPKKSPWCWEVTPLQHSEHPEGHMAGAGGFWAGTAFFVALEIVFWLFVQFTGGKGDKR